MGSRIARDLAKRSRLVQGGAQVGIVALHAQNDHAEGIFILYSGAILLAFGLPLLLRCEILLPPCSFLVPSCVFLFLLP